MLRRYCSVCLLLALVATLLFQCGEKQQDQKPTFTKADSLTDTYLSLKDSVLQAWNVMINDDDRKLTAMKHLLHELKVSGAADPSLIANYEERLAQLRRSRYNQKTMSNPDIVEEYDFASNALISELITLAESRKEFAYNPTLQKLTDQIRTADQRVAIYREQYDDITMKYNRFVDENSKYLKEIESDTLPNKKPLFQMALE